MIIAQPRNRNVTLVAICVPLALYACSGSEAASENEPQEMLPGADPGMMNGMPEAEPAPPGGVTGVGGQAPPAPVAGEPEMLLEEPEPTAPAMPEDMAGSLTDENACAAVELAPETIEVEVPTEVTITTEVLAPVALYVVLDNSLSMDSAADGAGNDADTKWVQAVDALSQFVQDPGSEGIDVALGYFNENVTVDDNNNQGGFDVPEDGPSCDGTAHSVPEVPMGPLPDNTEALVQSLNDAGPTGLTPTVGALTGGVAYCQQFQTDNPDEKCVVVLVTDGQPIGCGLEECEDGGYDCVASNAAEVLTPIATAGATAGVSTFTVGMAGVTMEGFALLDAVALAGGTDCSPDVAGAEACDVSATGSQGLLDALTAIRDSVTVTETITETMTVVETQTLSCQWGIPAVPEGETFDPAFVNVTLSIDGGPAENLGAVATIDDCAAVASGWYYDNPAAPTTIHACPQSCTVIEAAMNPAVQILLGCAAEPARPAGAR